MKKLVVFILALLSLVAAMPVQKGLPESAKGKTQYEVHFNRGGIHAKMATATLTLEDARWQEHPAYFANFTVRAANVFKLFMLGEYKVNILLSKEDNHPYTYSFPHKKKGKKRLLEFFYKEQEVESVLQIEDEPEPTRKVYPTEGLPTLDVASFALYLRSLDPATIQRGPMPVKLLLASVCIPAELTYLGEDNAFWPGEAAYHYQVKMQGRGLMENGAGDEIHIWVSPQPEHALRGLQVMLKKSSVLAKMVLPE